MSQDDAPEPARWGRRPYADVESRSILNDLSERIARKQPDHIDDPGDVSLSDVLREKYRQDTGDDAHAVTLAEMMRYGLDFEEAVCWFFYRFAGYDLGEIHAVIQGAPPNDGGAHRRNSLRNIHRILENAAVALPTASRDDVPDLADVDLEPAAEA